MEVYISAMHVVAILAMDGVVAFDLAVPCEVFSRVRLPNGRAAYDVRVCGATRKIDTGAFEIRTRWDLGGLAGANTVIVPGFANPLGPVPPRVIEALRAAAVAGARVASVCTGAFLLAAAGLLDGLRATTHWLAAEELARRYPKIEVDPGVLYVDNGSILTSAGAAAGLDLCLHLVRRDYGSAVAADAARAAVMPLERAGGQAQFIVYEPPKPDGASLEPLLRWMEQDIRKPLTLGAIARRAAMSTRTLSRRFRQQTGTTPLQWILRARVRRAQHLLESTGHSVEQVAMQSGFDSPTTFRTRFQRLVGTSPQAYRKAFQASTAR